MGNGRAKWGQNFPREYDTYKLMADSTTRTKYGGGDRAITWRKRRPT